MLVWRSETQPRALLPFIFILAMTYHSADTVITASRLSVCLLGWTVLMLNHGLVRTRLGVTSNQMGSLSSAHLEAQVLKNSQKPAEDMAPILRGVCLIMHGKNV